MLISLQKRRGESYMHLDLVGHEKQHDNHGYKSTFAIGDASHNG